MFYHSGDSTCWDLQVTGLVNAAKNSNRTDTVIAVIGYFVVTLKMGWNEISEMKEATNENDRWGSSSEITGSPCC